MKNRFIFFLFFLIFLLFLPKISAAAEVFFGVVSREISLDGTFEAGVFLNTQTQEINAIEGQIIFPVDFFDFISLRDGGSSITFWVSQPGLSLPGVISFSGIIPGGISGTKNYLFSFVLKAKKLGNASISSQNEKAYLNDGKGSITTIKRSPLVLNIVSKNPPAVFTPVQDLAPPESFEPYIVHEESIFGGKWFVVFAAQDKGSGVVKYEIKEKIPFWSFKFLIKNSRWITVENPHLLSDQSLQSFVYIKAIDRDGNEKIVKLNPNYKVPWYQNWLIWVIIILIVAVLGISWRFIKNGKFSLHRA